MIAYLKGKVLYQTDESLVLCVNGVGYEIFASGSVFRRANEPEVEVFTYMQVKEDGVALFGFSSLKEKELFIKLISVSGVGPKMGIAVLSSLSADELAVAIQTADVKRLSSVKGLGKKTAEKIVLELHGKISAEEILGAGGDFDVKPAQESTKLSATDEDAVSALQGLGFTRSESVHAVNRAREKGATTVEEIIMKALQG